MQAEGKRFPAINTSLKYLISPWSIYSHITCILEFAAVWFYLHFIMCVHMCCSAHTYVCHNMHVEAKEPPVGVCSLLPPHGSLESTQITRLGGKWLNSLSHLTGPVTFVWLVGMGLEMEPRAWSLLRTCPPPQQHPILCIWNQGLLLITLWVYRIKCNQICPNLYNEAKYMSLFASISQ